jgi:hypothetical protein
MIRNVTLPVRFLTTVGLAALLVGPVPAQAQSWLYATSRPPAGPVILREVSLTPSGPAAIGREVRIDGSLESAPTVTFDGRFVAWSMYGAGATQRALALFDRRTGSATLLPGLGGEVVVADPSALRLFVFKSTTSSFVDTIVVLEPDSVREIAVDPIRRVGPISADGRDLFVSRQIIDPGGSTWRYAIEVLDPMTGAVRRSLPPLTAFAEPSGIALSANGQRLYVSTNSPPEVHLLDAVSGVESAAVAIPVAPFAVELVGPITLDEAHDRLFVSRSRLSGSAGATGTASILNSLTLALVGGSSGNQQVIDRSLGVALSVGGFYSRFTGCTAINVETWDDAPAPVSSVTLPLDGGCLLLAIASPPAAPPNFIAAVSGRRVTLEWTAVPGAGDYQLEAGSAPGLSNLAVVRGGSTRRFVAEGVPPGTYYVRVRAVNDVGPGAPSIEQTVVVQ